MGRRALAFGMATLTAIGFAWVVESTSEFVRGVTEPGSVRLLIVGFIFFLGGSSFLYHLRRRLFGTRVIHWAIATPRHARACLIIILSRQRRHPDWKSRLIQLPSGEYKIAGRPAIITPDKTARDPSVADRVVADGIILTGRMDADIDLLDNFDTSQQWPWQQILRAIRPHLSKLERIWILGSPDAVGSPGSAGEMEECIRWLESYAEIRCQIRGGPDGHVVDFENYELLESKLRQVIQEEKEFPGSNDDRRIVIDITGGQKTTSVAAAAITLNSDVVFQYVQTNVPKKPIIYDITYDNPLFQEE